MDAHGERQRALSLRIVVVAALVTGAVAGCASATPAPSATSAAHEVLPFVSDDYARAVREAKAKKVPIFVDAWAPWCHSCQSMRAFVLTDPQLAPLAKDFVWLAIDTEKDENGPFVAKFQNRVWPTLWVIDPTDEAPLMKYEGTATAPELVTLLTPMRSGATSDAFRDANRLAARGQWSEALAKYHEAMLSPSADRPRLVEAIVSAFALQKQPEGCADIAAKEGPTLPPGTSRAVVLATGLSCARDAKKKEALAILLPAAEKAARDPDPRTVADDRSSLYDELVETKKDAGDDTAAKATAREWATFLEGEASKAKTNEARAVFDAHRLSAYLAAGEPERAIPMLTASEKDFPADYNPPARLARAYLTMKKLDDAQSAVERAGARVYGPRSLRVFVLAADIAKEKGDKAAEAHALEQGLAKTAKAVMNESQKKLRDSLAQRLGALRP